MRTVGDLLVEFVERPGRGVELPVLTLTERRAFVRQADRFHKRLATEDTSSYKLIRRSDIAFNPYLLWAGAVAQNTVVDAGIISPLYPTFRVREGHDARYVARLLLTPELIAAYDGIAFGSVPRRRRSSVADFLALQLPTLPPLPQQRRIAAILDQADAVRAERRQVLARLDTLTQSIFHEMFAADRSELMRACELMPEMRNGLSPARNGRHLARVLTLSAVTQGSFDATAFKPGTFAHEPPHSMRVSARDFLMCRGNGNKSLVGVGTYSRDDRPDLVFPDTVIAGRVDPRRVTLAFLQVAWNQPAVRRQIEAVAHTTNGTYKVNQQTLGGVQVRMPPIDQQHAFAVRAGRVNAQRVTVQRALAADDELFGSLQSRAFRGEL